MKTTTRRWLLVATAATALVGCSSAELSEGVSPDDTVAPIDGDSSSAGAEQNPTAQGAAVVEETPSSVATPTAPATTTAAPAPTTAAPASTTEPAAATAAPTAPPAVAPLSQPTCGYLGADDFGDMQLELQFVNPLGDVGSLQLTYALKDAGGTHFHTGTAYFEHPRADERFRAEYDTVESAPPGLDAASVGCEVLAIEDGFGGDSLESAGDGSGCTFVEIDSFGDIQVELTATSAFESTEDLQIFYVLRGPEGSRFDDATAYVDLVAPGETIRPSEDTLTQAPSWVDADGISCEVLGLTASDF